MKDIVIVCCGSFNPIHDLHLLIFELVKNNFALQGRKVVKGIISPVNDNYKKPELISSEHRVAMCKEAVKTSDWIVVDDWESKQEKYVRTYNVLKHLREELGDQYDIYFIGSDDLLDGMMNPNCWDQVLLEKLLSEFGFVLLQRMYSNLKEKVEAYPLFKKYIDHIHIFETFKAQHNSTEIRNLIKQGLSVKYMTQDCVIEYIKKNNLYQ